MERKELIAKAEELGVEFKGNISTIKLEELVEAAEMAAKEATYDKPEPKPEGTTAKVNKGTLRRDALKMIHCIITPLDERQRTLPSEMYSVGNKNLGFIKKVVSFGRPTIEPQIIIQMLKEKRSLIQQTQVVNGIPKTTKREGSAFAIEILPDLTKEEYDIASGKK